VPSDDHAECVSSAGAFDMLGNIAEWVRAGNGGHAMKGCFWAGCFGGARPSCGFTNSAHASGFRSYEAGFRCCASRSHKGAP
jgi:hypothetical protein